jgi:hypothetical protein
VRAHHLWKTKVNEMGREVSIPIWTASCLYSLIDTSSLSTCNTNMLGNHKQALILWIPASRFSFLCLEASSRSLKMEPQSVVLKEVVALAQRALISTLRAWMDCFSLFPDRVDWGAQRYTPSQDFHRQIHRACALECVYGESWFASEAAHFLPYLQDFLLRY